MRNRQLKSAVIRWSVLLVSFFTLTTCLDEIDLTQGEALPDGLVLQGRLNVRQDGSPAEVLVRLERLFIAQESNRPTQVVNADITVENSEGQSFDLRFDTDGIYRAVIPDNEPGFRVEVGLGYRLRAIIPGGEEYLTEFDVLQPPLAIEEAGARPSTTMVENVIGQLEPRPSIQFTVTAPVRYPDGSPTYLRFLLERTFKVTDTPTNRPFQDNDPKSCYVTQVLDGGDLVLFNSANVAADRVEDFELTNDAIDAEYAEGYVMTILQEAISRPAFDYFDQVDRIASRESSLFEPPAGPVVGNAFDVNGNTNNVFGFFYTANRAQARVAVSPETAGNPTKICPLPPSMSPFPPPNDCDDCLRLNGSQLERPVWFPF